MTSHGLPERGQRTWSWGFALLLVLLFCFRLGFGLTSEFWSEDELQIYLLGLKAYCGQQWPYFGPDVFPNANPVVQIPGALQGVLVGGPLFLFPVPEAPYLLLNVLSFAALSLLAAYCTRRLPGLPPVAVWTWAMTAPWVLEYSTHVLNPSYVLFGSTLFFVGMLESCRPLRRNFLPLPVASFFMGFALTWTMQLHLSWVVLVPYVLLAALMPAAEGARARIAGAACFFAGAAIPAALIVPTLAKYGLSYGMGGQPEAVTFHVWNLRTLFTILVRYLSFATISLHRFVSDHSAGWASLLGGHPWLVPIVAIPGVAGVVQSVALIGCWFRKSHPESDWPAIKHLTLFSFVLICASFLFATKRPKAHTFYVCFPLIFIYSLYCWAMFTSERLWKTVVPITLAAGIVAQGSYAAHEALQRSLYRAREIPVSAIERRDYRLLGERRTGARF